MSDFFHSPRKMWALGFFLSLVLVGIIGFLPENFFSDLKSSVTEGRTVEMGILPEDFEAVFEEQLKQDEGQVRGEALVKFKEKSIDVESRTGQIALASFESKKSVVEEDTFEEDNLVVIRSKKGETTEALIARLKNDPKIEYIEPNTMREMYLSPDDAEYSKLWGFSNIGQAVNESDEGAEGADISAEQAWDEFTGNDSIIVAVIDTGVAHQHPDLQGNMWDGSRGCKDENNEDISGGCPNHGWDFVNSDNDPTDDQGHGTHVAGIIGAVGNNARGVTGVNWKVKIMALKAGNENGGFPDDAILKAIHFAKNNGAQVINASFGGGGSSKALKEAIDDFPGLFIAAAGNSGKNHELKHSYPSDYDSQNILSVAATDQNDKLASFSDYGIFSVDVAAPGVDIYSTYPALSTPFSENFSSGTQLTKDPDPKFWSLGKNKIWTDISGGGNTSYVPNANTSLTSPSIDLTGKINAKLSFLVFCNTDSKADYLELGISKNSEPYKVLAKIHENAIKNAGGDPVVIKDKEGKEKGRGYYSELEFDLYKYVRNQVRLRYRWVTDGSNQKDTPYLSCFLMNIQVTSVNEQGEQYKFLDGTSMAAPYVTGATALILGYQNDLTMNNVKSALLNSGDRLPSLSSKISTGSRINLAKALESLRTPVSPTPPTTGTPPSMPGPIMPPTEMTPPVIPALPTVPSMPTMPTPPTMTTPPTTPIMPSTPPNMPMPTYPNSNMPMMPSEVPRTNEASSAPAMPPIPTIDEYCGDGVRNGSEECDDANFIPGDGCSPRCNK